MASTRNQGGNARTQAPPANAEMVARKANHASVIEDIASDESVLYIEKPSASVPSVFEAGKTYRVSVDLTAPCTFDRRSISPDAEGNPRDMYLSTCVVKHGGNTYSEFPCSASTALAFEAEAIEEGATSLEVSFTVEVISREGKAPLRVANFKWEDNTPISYSIDRN